MKKVFLMLSLASALSFAACNNDTETTDTDADNDTVTVEHHDTTVIIQERETYRTNLQHDIDRMQAQLDSMSDRAENKTSKAWQETKTDLQMRIDRAKANLQEAGNKADNDWDAFKMKVDAEMDTLRMKWDAATTKKDKK